MEMTTNAINWFEIPVTDFDRAKKFYSAIFDFEMPEMQMGPNRMGFLLHEQGKGVGGAILQGEGYTPARTGSIVYLAGGNDLDTVLKRVEKAGGKVAVPKTDIGGGMGFWAHFTDTEGNKVGLHSMG
jgi:predicted enzyme related to lactoylglutathione lyase